MHLRDAIARLRAEVSLDRLSTYYETEPVGFEDQPRFLNAVALGRTDLPPRQLLTFIKGIEEDLGREPTFRDGPRVLDIDILLFGVGDFPSGAVIMRTPELTIPHPRLHERAFALVPLAEIEPHVTHPVLGRTVRDLARDVGEAGIRRWVP